MDSIVVPPILSVLWLPKDSRFFFENITQKELTMAEEKDNGEHPYMSQ